MAKTITLVGASNQPKRNSPFRGYDELVFGALISDDVANQDTFLEWPARCYAISATAIRVEPNAAPFYDLDEADTGLTPTEMLEELAGVYGGSGGAASGVITPEIQQLNVTFWSENQSKMGIEGTDGLVIPQGTIISAMLYYNVILTAKGSSIANVSEGVAEISTFTMQNNSGGSIDQNTGQIQQNVYSNELGCTFSITVDGGILRPVASVTGLGDGSEYRASCTLIGNLIKV